MVKANDLLYKEKDSGKHGQLDVIKGLDLSNLFQSPFLLQKKGLKGIAYLILDWLLKLWSLGSLGVRAWAQEQC